MGSHLNWMILMSFKKTACALAAILLLMAPGGILLSEPEPAAVAPSSIDDYIDDLLAMQPLSESRSGVRMSIEVVHDAYLYFMAKKYEEYQNFGFDEELLVGKLRSAHTKFKRFKNRLYFRIHISGEGSNHVIFDKKLSSHLEVSQKSKKNTLTKRAYHALNVSPTVKFSRWTIFGKSVLSNTKKNLFGFQKLRAEVTSYSIKGNNKEPIYFRLKDIRVQGKGINPGSSINVEKHQIATKKSWGALKVYGPTVVMTPGNWDVPLPPTEFLNILKKLGYK